MEPPYRSRDPDGPDTVFRFNRRKRNRIGTDADAVFGDPDAVFN